MATTKLSSKGQVIIPKAIRSSHRWEAGLDLMVIGARGQEQGVLLFCIANRAPRRNPAHHQVVQPEVITNLRQQIAA